MDLTSRRQTIGPLSVIAHHGNTRVVPQRRKICLLLGNLFCCIYGIIHAMAIGNPIVPINLDLRVVQDILYYLHHLRFMLPGNASDGLVGRAEGDTQRRTLGNAEETFGNTVLCRCLYWWSCKSKYSHLLQTQCRYMSRCSLRISSRACSIRNTWT